MAAPAPSRPAATSAPETQDRFYGDDEGSAAVYETGEQLLQSLRDRKKAAAAGGGAGGSSAHAARVSHTQQRESAWIHRQMVASGVGVDADAEAEAAAAAGNRWTSAASERVADLAVNRALIPNFIRGDDGEAIIFSRQRGLVIPVKDPKSDFAELASKGSEALREHRKRKSERDAMVAAVEGSSKSFAASLGIGTSTAPKAAAPAVPEPTADTADAAPDDAASDRSAINAVRRGLPIYRCRSELMSYIRDNPVVVIAGETGSGKTTQMVQYLLEDGYARHGRGIACSQPRRMAAVGVAMRVADEVGCEIGDRVGYAIRLEDKTSAATQIKFMTDGVLLRELIGDRLLNKYSVVVMDEAHERSVNTDVLLGAMKHILINRLDFRLIVTSATMELHKFANFFNAPIFTIPGRTFPIETNYEANPVSDYVEQAVLRVLEVHTQQPPGDVLVFMTGEDDVEGTCDLLRSRAAELGDEIAATLVVLPCYSMLPSAQQRQILNRAPAGRRKCIVATNIAETSLTIDGIRYVVDCGYMKCKVFKPNIGMNALNLYPVSRAQANQRQGRAGRTAEGVCYRLYTQFMFEHETLDAPVPEIQRSSIDAVVLLLKGIGVDDIASFDFLDAPPHENLRASLYRLWLIQALDDAGFITDAGRRMADFPADPPLARALLAACELGCGEEAAAVAGVMSADARSIFATPRGREEAASAAREKFFAPDSDHITMLNVFDQFQSHGQSKQWADEHFLHYLALKRAVDVTAQFKDRLRRDFKLTLGSCSGDHDLIREAFAYGFFPHAARRTGVSEYTSLLNGVPCDVHPMSAVRVGGAPPDYVIYNDFIMTGTGHQQQQQQAPGKPHSSGGGGPPSGRVEMAAAPAKNGYMSVVSAVDAAWLVRASRGLFTFRDSGLMKHQAELAAEQRKALAAVRRDPVDNVARPPQPPAAPAASGVGGSTPVAAAPADGATGSKPARFQPRRRA